MKAKNNFELNKQNHQWRGNYFWTRGGKTKIAKIGTRNRGLRWNWRVFSSRKQAFSKKKGLRRNWSIFWPENFGSPKKGLRRILERCLVPNAAHDTGLREGKIRLGHKTFIFNIRYLWKNLDYHPCDFFSRN